VTDRRRSFWPVVAVGAAAAALMAVSAGRAWVKASAEVAGVASHATAKGSEAAPLALALALVGLAAWGAVLVVRRAPRRVVAVIGLLASLGVVVAAVRGLDRARHDALAALAGKTSSADATLHVTGWYAATLIGAALAALGFAATVVLAAGWPEMAARYDAPTTRRSEEDQADLWRAMDEGHDPTA
jgi:uncharacterized membrane protein (TIGR02234 family)